YLADTNAVSEFSKKQPNQQVVDWFAAQAEESLFLSVITIGEIEKGIARIIDPVGKAKYEIYLENLVLRFDRRILPISLKIGRRWGHLFGTLQKSGRVLPNWDSLIAATALEHDLTIITRNTDDFAGTGARVLNVWE
ncbi:MAG: type II toxin-antitoxin system VapC family toxin, partial [Acidobacteriota bacterium]|nr:type II toxin-antitoxin system VapC family toxin [Acidobacteriota bacterium]